MTILNERDRKILGKFQDQIIVKLVILWVWPREQTGKTLKLLLPKGIPHYHTTTCTIIYENSLKTSRRRKHNKKGGRGGDTIWSSLISLGRQPTNGRIMTIAHALPKEG